jgi:hypothetical protein
MDIKGSSSPHGIGSALIENGGHSVLGEMLLTELLTTAAKVVSVRQQKWRKQHGA